MFNSFVVLLCVSVGPNRTKLVTPNSSLKFTPEELVLYCRDMRVMCFLFDRLTPDAQVIEVCPYLIWFMTAVIHTLGRDTHSAGPESHQNQSGDRYISCWLKFNALFNEDALTQY